MTSTITVSSDIAAITDRVMLRHLTPVPREQAEALVRMVLDCAGEAAPMEVVELRHFSVQIDRVEEEADRLRAFVSLLEPHPLATENWSASTPVLTTNEGRQMAARLRDFVGQRVVVGVRHELVRPNFKGLIVREIELATSQR